MEKYISEFVTVTEAASILGVTRAAVYGRIQRETIDYTLDAFNGKHLINREYLKELLAQKEKRQAKIDGKV